MDPRNPFVLNFDHRHHIVWLYTKHVWLGYAKKDYDFYRRDLEKLREAKNEGKIGFYIDTHEHFAFFV